MADKMAVEVKEYLKSLDSLRSNIKYVLASKTMLLASGVELINIIDALSGLTQS